MEGSYWRNGETNVFRLCFVPGSSEFKQDEIALPLHHHGKIRIPENNLLSWRWGMTRAHHHKCTARRHPDHERADTQQ